MTTPAAPLPGIGGLPTIEPTPLSYGAYVDSSNRLAAIRIAGNDMTSTMNNAVKSLTMSYSSTQIGQFTLILADSPDAAIIKSGILRKGTTIDFGDQHLDVVAVDVAVSPGGPTLTIKAQSRVVTFLKAQTGQGSWGEQDSGQWVLDRCREAGAHPVVGGGLGAQTFVRQQYAAIESTWDVMQRAAKVSGVLCYEFEQIVTYMKPSQLAIRSRARWWDLFWNSNSDYTAGLTGMPTYHWASGGDEQLTWSMVSADAELARPGDGATMNGAISDAAGDWIVTQVNVPTATTAPVVVTAGRIIDPVPTPVAGAV